MQESPRNLMWIFVWMIKASLADSGREKKRQRYFEHHWFLIHFYLFSFHSIVAFFIFPRMLLNSDKKFARTVNPVATIVIIHAVFKSVRYDNRISNISSKTKAFRIFVTSMIKISWELILNVKRDKIDRSRLTKNDCAMNKKNALDTNWKVIVDLTRF